MLMLRTAAATLLPAGQRSQVVMREALEAANLGEFHPMRARIAGIKMADIKAATTAETQEALRSKLVIGACSAFRSQNDCPMYVYIQRWSLARIAQKCISYTS